MHVSKLKLLRKKSNKNTPKKDGIEKEKQRVMVTGDGKRITDETWAGQLNTANKDETIDWHQ